MPKARRSASASCWAAASSPIAVSPTPARSLYLPAKPVARSIPLTSTRKPHIDYPRLAFSRLRVALPHPTRPCLLPAPRRPALHLSPAPLPRAPSSGSISHASGNRGTPSHLFRLTFRWAEDLAFHPTRAMPLLVSWTRLRLSGPTPRLRRPPTPTKYRLFLDLFSGASAPLSSAVAALGLDRVAPIDCLRGEHVDILDPVMQDSLRRL